MPTFAGEILFFDDVKPRDIERPKTVDSDIFLIRLYQVAQMGGCGASDESCLNHCALLVATGGMPPDVRLFDLGVVGEITDVQWVSSPPRRVLSQNPRVMAQSAEATLSVTVQNYPSHAFADHPDFAKRTKRYLVKVSLDSVAVSPAP